MGTDIKKFAVRAAVVLLLGLMMWNCQYTLLRFPSNEYSPRRFSQLPADTSYHPTPDNFPGYDTLYYLFQNWSRLNGNDRDSILTFTPLDEKSFPVRGRRDVFICEPNGYCEWYSIKPGSSQSLEFGVWKLFGQESFTLILYDDDKKFFGAFRILHLSKDYLELQRVSNPDPPTPPKPQMEYDESGYVE